MRILKFDELVLEKSIGSESIRMKWYSDITIGNKILIINKNINNKQ